MKKTMTIVKGMMLAVFGMASASAHAQDAFPSYLNVRGIQYAGTGCAAGSVAQNVSQDLQAFTLLFDSFIAQTGPGVSIAESRKNCNIILDLDYPSGWQFSVVAVDVRGYAALDAGIQGQQVTTGYLQGSRDQFRTQQDFYGPTAQDYLASTEIPLANANWSPCSAPQALRPLVLSTQVRMQSGFNRFARGLMTVDSIDGSVLMTYAIRWRHCGAPGRF